MKRVINQINVSITTNRTCTLRCDHCYIEPHLFDDKTRMTEETYRLIFDRIEELKAIDHNLTEIEWEAIGGETTMMPFEFWERQLPWTLDRIAKINTTLRSPGSLNFLTNLIYKDPRYTDLFNQYAEHPAFCLYTSWEPDTNRFGKRNQLFQRFYDTLKSIKASQKILDIILTKSIIEMGAERILDLFLPAGITDFSMKMISPYGSGKAFFEPNMSDFQSMTQFFRDMERLKPANVTFTPQEEMLSTLMRGTSFQCNGNFKYDLSIEPEGTCHFNANQTASEAALGFKTLDISDPDWAYKVCFENKVEENNKLSLQHAECDQCVFMPYCNAGWYHYKVADPRIIDQYRADECSGYKQFWQDNLDKLGRQGLDRSAHLHRLAVRSKLSRHDAKSPGDDLMRETELPYDYDQYFTAARSMGEVVVDRQSFFGKTLLQRLWWYDDLRVKAFVPAEILAESKYTDRIVEHYLYTNYHTVELDKAFLKDFLATSNSVIARRFRAACAALRASRGDGIASQGDRHGLVIDARNEELFRTIVAQGLVDEHGNKALALESQESAYLTNLIGNITREESIRGIS